MNTVPTRDKVLESYETLQKEKYNPFMGQFLHNSANGFGSYVKKLNDLERETINIYNSVSKLVQLYEDRKALNEIIKTSKSFRSILQIQNALQKIQDEIEVQEMLVDYYTEFRFDTNHHRNTYTDGFFFKFSHN